MFRINVVRHPCPSPTADYARSLPPRGPAPCSRSCRATAHIEFIHGAWVVGTAYSSLILALQRAHSGDAGALRRDIVVAASTHKSSKGSPVTPCFRHGIVGLLHLQHLWFATQGAYRAAASWLLGRVIRDVGVGPHIILWPILIAGSPGRSPSDVFGSRYKASLKAARKSRIQNLLKPFIKP